MTVTAYERILDKLRDQGKKVRANGTKATAQCPAHDDKDPSLSITRAPDRVLLHCHAGCALEDVIAALELTKGDLWDNPKDTQWDYRYPDGRLNRTVHRSYKPDGTRKIRQANIAGGPILLHVDEVNKAVQRHEKVYLVEGEPDVEVVRQLGVTATTAPQGGDHFDLVDITPLINADIIAIRDLDKTESGWARQVWDKLNGYARSITFKKAAAGKDVSDRIAAGHPIKSLLDDPQHFEPAERRLKVTRASEIMMKATRWLWEEYGNKWIPLGALALLGGREGVGKSTTSYDCVAKITRGLLPGHLYGTPKSVIVCATEDAWSETIVPKLLAAGANLERVLRVDSVSPEGFEGALSLPADVQRLKQLIGQEDVAFVLLDPLLSTLDIKIDSHKDAEVRLALEPLSRLAHDTEVSMLGLIHENKSGAADLLTRIMGSRAFTAVVRAVLYCARHEDELDDAFGMGNLFDRYVFGQLKSNLGPRAKFGIKYHIESVHVGHDDELNLPIWNSKVVWDGLTDESIQDIVTAQERRRAKSPNVETAQGKAEKWLEAYLSKHGPIPSKKVKAMAGHDGHSEASIKRAADAMDVHIAKIPGTHNETTWELPPPPTPTTSQVELTELTDLSELTEPTDKGVGS